MKTYIILLVTVFSLFACHKESGQKEIQQDCYTPPTLEIYINKGWCYKKYDTDLDISIIDVKES